MTATHKPDCTFASAPVLYMALELSSGFFRFKVRGLGFLTVLS